MTKAGERLIGGMKEAMAIAKGEQTAASITVNGQTYVPVEAMREAVRALEEIVERANSAHFVAQTNTVLHMKMIAEMALSAIRARADTEEAGR